MEERGRASGSASGHKYTVKIFSKHSPDYLLQQPISIQILLSSPEARISKVDGCVAPPGKL